MGLRDRVHEWQWRARNGIGYEQLKAIRKETMEMLEKRDIKGLKGLLDTYAGSYDIPEEIATGIAREKFILTPEDAADKDDGKPENHPVHAAGRLSCLASG